MYFVKICRNHIPPFINFQNQVILKLGRFEQKEAGATSRVLYDLNMVQDKVVLAKILKEVLPRYMFLTFLSVLRRFHAYDNCQTLNGARLHVSNPSQARSWRAAAFLVG